MLHAQEDPSTKPYMTSVGAPYPKTPAEQPFSALWAGFLVSETLRAGLQPLINHRSGRNPYALDMGFGRFRWYAS